MQLTIEQDLHLGDADLNTTTNVLDFNEWNAHKFGSEPTTWRQGDFTGDGKTNILDFNVWNEHKFTSAGNPPPLVKGQVPEPSMLMLTVAAVALLLGVPRLRKWAWLRPQPPVDGQRA